MTKIKDVLSISEARYIEIKEMAYEYYKRYNSLERPERRKFLEALPSLNTDAENNILRCSLIFPDTEYLLGLPKGKVYSTLAQMAHSDDNATTQDVLLKASEYATLNIRNLVKSGKIKIMDAISYPDDSIPDKEYIEAKKSALDFLPSFNELTFGDKTQLIEDACKTNTYQAKIQIATLLIPNDMLLMQYLKNASVSEVAEYYKVPVSLIEFKQEEYNKQGTDLLINDGKLLEYKSRRVWHMEDFDIGYLDKLFDQSFYKSIQDNGIEKINGALGKLFDKPTSKVIK